MSSIHSSPTNIETFSDSVLEDSEFPMEEDFKADDLEGLAPYDGWDPEKNPLLLIRTMLLNSRDPAEIALDIKALMERVLDVKKARKLVNLFNESEYKHFMNYCCENPIVLFEPRHLDKPVDKMAVAPPSKVDSVEPGAPRKKKRKKIAPTPA